MQHDRESFLMQLKARFPEVFAQIDQYQQGQLHCEVAVLRQATEAAMDDGHLWQAEQHFRFVEELLAEASPELRNALDVSYLEDLGLGGCTPARHRAVKERMPRAMKDILVRHHDQWR